MGREELEIIKVVMQIDVEGKRGRILPVFSTVI